MEWRDNYAIQSAWAKKIFLEYNQENLIHKLGLDFDAQWLYTRLFDRDYRIDRTSGDMERRDGNAWQDGNSFHEVLTMFDLICDSREDRFLTGRLKNMTGFGRQFHQSLMEEGKDPFAQAIQENQLGFRSACEAMGGRSLQGADIAYDIPVFQELSVVLSFWEGDDEFAPRLRFLWDENAWMYLKYETMYYAVHFLKERLQEKMDGFGEMGNG